MWWARNGRQLTEALIARFGGAVKKATFVEWTGEDLMRKLGVIT